MFHASLIELWPNLSAFADDIGVRYVTAKAMRRRGSVPGRYWNRMVASAKSRGISGVSLETLATIAEEAAQ